MASKLVRARKSAVPTKSKDQKKPIVFDEATASVLNFLVRSTKGQLKELLRDLIPTDLRTQLNQSMRYAEGESDLIQSIVETKVDFYAAGFGVQLKTPNTNYKEKLLDRVKMVIREHDLKKIAEELIFDFSATDNAILQWKVDGGKISYVTTISPDRVQYSNSVGHEVLMFELSEETIRYIRSNLVSRDLAAQLRLDFPEKYIDAVQKGKRYVELLAEDGEYWIVRTRRRRFSGLARPSMYAIFFDVLLREMLVGGDWAIAYFIKRVIEHVKIGEKFPTGLHSNDPKVLYPLADEVKSLQAQFQKLGDTMRLFTNHTVEIDYKYPDPKIFAPEKFQKVEERILRWGAVIDVLMTGKGEGFSQGHLGARRFIAQGRRVRETIGEMFEKFLLHDSIRGILQIPKGSDVKTTWDMQNLKDPKQVMDELNSAFDHGVLDVQTYHEGFGYDYEMIKERKKEDTKDKELWVPVFEPAQGLLNKPGRPGEGKPPEADPAKPKPSTKGA